MSFSELGHIIFQAQMLSNIISCIILNQKCAEKNKNHKSLIFYNLICQMTAEFYICNKKPHQNIQIFEKSADRKMDRLVSGKENGITDTVMICRCSTKEISNINKNVVYLFKIV